MSFGDIIRSAPTPTATPYGIGGNATKIWHCEGTTDRIYELNVSDFSTARSAAAPSAFPVGIGGNANKIWHSEYAAAGKIYELSTVDLSSIRNALSPSTAPSSIGGDTDTIWHCDQDADKIYELSTTDFSTIRLSASPSIKPSSIGGNANTIWHCDQSAHKIYDIDESDFSVIRLASSPSSFSTGVGGDTDTIWHCELSGDKTYELDAPPSTHTISGTVSDEFGNKIRNVDITFSDGSTYTTTTDGSGAYSQVVNPDTYNITASKPRSKLHITTESKVISSDTTFDIIMPTDKVVGKQYIQGMSIHGGISIGARKARR